MKTETTDEILEQFTDLNIPQIYFNGFGVLVTSQDSVLVLTRNNQRVALLNASHGVIKTLAQTLSQSIAEFEQKTNITVLTTDQLQAILHHE